MPIDQKYILFSLANTFNTTLGVDISDDTKSYIKSVGKNFAKLETQERVYYTKYSIQLAQKLSDYLEGIKMFEINTDENPEVVHDFRLKWKKGNVAHISLLHGSINIRDIIPEKLMKICKYKKNTKNYKLYMENYIQITERAYKNIKSKKKYSELSDKSKNKNLINPICQLVYNTLSKKRKCAAHLYKHLFSESDRIVLKLYKNRFSIYDFGKEIDNVESFRLKMGEKNELIITFNNGVKFSLALQTNASEIKEHISLKFHTNLKNMDDLFAVSNSSI